jgi:TBC1 domain family protein 5
VLTGFSIDAYHLIRLLQNPWTEWFAQVELRKTILQDVERTYVSTFLSWLTFAYTRLRSFPEIGFFRDSEVQSQLTNVLFLYSVTNPDIGYFTSYAQLSLYPSPFIMNAHHHYHPGYRQGMHELLAPLYYAVDYDSIEDENSALDDAIIREICSRKWVAADAWSLFDSVMHGVERWYEWRESPPTASSRNNASPLATHINLNIPDGRVDMQPYVVPVVQACNHIQSTLLQTVDPLLWKHMQTAGIEPQIYGM